MSDPENKPDPAVVKVQPDPIHQAVGVYLQIGYDNFLLARWHYLSLTERAIAQTRCEELAHRVSNSLSIPVEITP